MPDTRRLPSLVAPLGLLAIALWGVLAILPLVWMVVTSLKTSSQVFTYPPIWVPSPVTLEHYRRILEASPFPRMFLNSAVVGIVVTALQLTTSTLAGFAFARLVFPGRTWVFLLFLGTLMIPEQVTFVPLFIVARYGHLVDTYFGLILPTMVSPFGIFLLRQAFMTVPRELEDAARIDGCNTWQTLWRVLVPVVRPSMATVALFAFLGSWNTYFWPLIVTQSTEMRTLPVGLRYFLSDPDLGTDWGALMAASTLTLLPVLLLFAITQRQFVQGLLAGSLKA